MAQTTPKLPEALDAIRGVLPDHVAAKLDRVLELRAARRASAINTNRFKAGPQRPKMTGDPAIDGPAAEQYRADRHAYRKAMATNSAMTSVARSQLYAWARTDGAGFLAGPLRDAVTALLDEAADALAKLDRFAPDYREPDILRTGAPTQIMAWRTLLDLDQRYQPLAVAAREILKEVHGCDYAARRAATVALPTRLADAAHQAVPV
ncbi:hypothetical protein RB614_19720 [Phytohabitans sp. ZYX-F-186]|uniref:Uncharacterized protein n=1 Tax=Phytohabitans maris TaxID=3071409 RepID=A0ABU0ZI87_9ACTN|nr:hypothetical protein [Phytohabitans sp. ZYX-F-186]MDQ7906748.1 hypothetical protein [Phytohabitans sp. ZYX-F-186]